MRFVACQPVRTGLCGALACVWSLSAAAAINAAAESPQAVQTHKVRLRLEWGGGPPQQWNGLVEISTGRFTDPTSLAVEADSPGSIWVDGGAVWVQRRTARVYDGFDVTVEGPPQAVLTVTLQGAHHSHLRQQVELKLKDLDAPFSLVPIGAQGARLVVRRTPGDALQVAVDRAHLVYEPAEHFRAKVTPNLLTLPPRSVETSLRWQLTPARSSTVLATGSHPLKLSQDGNRSGAVPLDVALPEQEGAYDIALQIAGTGLAPVESTVQVLVVSSQSVTDEILTSAETTGMLVDSFSPTSPGLFRQVDRRRDRQFLNRTLRRLLSRFPQWQEPSQPEAYDGEPSIEWHAYWLRVAHPGRPHRLVVSLPARPQALGISILEPNAAAQLMPLTRDSGLYTPRSAPDDTSSADQAGPASPIQHVVTFWPKRRNPIVLLHDMGTGHPVRADNIELFELSRLTPHTVADELAGDIPRRLIGPYIHKPNLPETFGASEAYDAPSHRSLDDWQTFYTAGRRLTDYLKHAGYNSLLLAVFADGGTIYPSRWLQPTPRYDTGVHSSAGHDPVRKDVLEMLYRLFDREHLVLIPELQFSTPLPELELLLSTGGSDAHGIELVHADGQTWREVRGSDRGLAPYYNPLDARVQEAVLRAVQEVVERYRHHESFGGVAVELSGIGYIQLPGLEWGYDDATVARFEAETGIRVPEPTDGEPYPSRYRFLTQQVQQKWIRWRCEELARFHKRLAQTVTSAHPTARFVLAGNQILRGPNADDEVSDALRTHGKLARLLLPRGLDFHLHADSERFVILKPSLWEVDDGTGRTARDQAVNQNSSYRAVFAGRTTGSLFYHVPRECRLAEFDAISPWQPAYTWLAAQASPAGVANRERFADALASNDSQLIFDGGWTIPFGQEDHTSRARDVVRALPAIPFHLSEVQQQPAVVRIARHSGATYLYVVNELDVDIEVSLRLSTASGTPARRLGEPGAVALVAQPDGKSLAAFKLEPYGVWACRIDDDDARVEDVAVQLPQTVIAGLKGSIRRFEQSLNRVQSTPEREQSVLANPGFEATPQTPGELPGWKLSERNAAFWTLDRSNPRSGDTSLLLAAGRSDLAALSSDLPPINSRMLLMTLWLRSDREDTDVRLVFEASLDDRPRVQYANVTVDRHWKHYRFRVGDIPAGQLQDAKVRIEMRGPGKIWIDDVDIRLHRLSPDDVRQLTKVLSAVTLAWENERYTDCNRLLQSYWGQFLMEQSTASADATPMSPAEPGRFRGLFRR